MNRSEIERLDKRSHRREMVEMAFSGLVGALAMIVILKLFGALLIALKP
jgi:hypothetical protein